MRAAAFAFCPQKTTETTPFRVFEQRRRHHQQRIGRHFITEFYRRKRRPSSSFSALSSSSEMPETTPESLKRLQNGSDVRGVALAGVENEPNQTGPHMYTYQVRGEWMERLRGVPVGSQWVCHCCEMTAPDAASRQASGGPHAHPQGRQAGTSFALPLANGPSWHFSY